MRSRHARFIVSIGAVFLLWCLAATLAPAQASIVVQGGSLPQQAILQSLYRRVPAKFRCGQPILVRLLADDAMSAAIHDGDAHMSDDDMAAIDGIYQTHPSRIFLRAGRPEDEVQSVFAHEYGHFVWQALISSHQRDVFQKIYAVDKEEHHLITDYAGAGPEEGFAEAFGVFVLCPQQLAASDFRSYLYLSALAVAGAAEPGGSPALHGEWEESEPAIEPAL